MDILYFSRHTLRRNSVNMELVEFLAAQNFSLIYLSTHGDVLENTILKSPIHETSIKVLSHRYKINKLLNYLYSSLLIIKYYFKYRPKLIIFHDSVYAPVLILINFFTRAKVGVHFHEIIWNCGYNRFINYFLLVQEKFLFKYLSVAIFSSERRMLKTTEHLKISNLESQCVVFPNFPISATPVLVNREKLQRKLIYFGAVNDFILIELIKVLKMVNDYAFRVDLYVFGSGVTYLKEYFKNSSYISFFDPVPRTEILKIIPNYMASICVYKSDNLNNILCEPRKIYDSINCSVPVIINEIEPPFFVKDCIIKLNDFTPTFLEGKIKYIEENICGILEIMEQYNRVSRKSLAIYLSTIIK
jgi:hypothetical protein